MRTKRKLFLLAAAPAVAALVSLWTPEAQGTEEVVAAAPAPLEGVTPEEPLWPDPQAPRALPELEDLQLVIEQYEQLEATGGWPHVPDGPKLHIGMTDSSIPAMRRRLIASGDLAADLGDSKSFDRPLDEAVQRFQKRHGLQVDGVVGERTRAAMNVSVRDRIEQLEINLARLKGLPAAPDDRYIVVNIPDYSLRLYSNGAKVLESPVVVGKDTWRTPTFESTITEIVFNPSWFIPSSIARKEILPKDAANPGYIARQGIRVSHTAESIRLRQPPGPKNPLGRVKFHTPNKYGVFLHDTPNKQLMSQSARAFSHGCVRVRDAVPLAAALLSVDPTWDQARQERILESWKTRYVPLETPVPIHVVYLTAWQENGYLNFRPDIYGWDEVRAEAVTTTSR